MSTATLNWVLPTQDVNNDPLPPSQIISVSILDGGAVIGSAPGPATTFTTPDLSVGDHVFTVVVNDAAGASAPSNSATGTVAPPPQGVPQPATNLTVVINP